MIRIAFLVGLGGLSLNACGMVQGNASAPDNGFNLVRSSQVPPPPGAEPGSCWGRDITPAVLETVTHQVQVDPATQDAAGKILSPATYRTETTQQIVQERAVVLFQTPCPDLVDTEFTASLQRALSARGLFAGEINGTYDGRTQRAVRAFQMAEGGPNSGILSLEGARLLGLVAYERSDL
ncbi:peptidoglycan-binding domain-containing protein [Pseudogemmobacter sp. W21_MBD1_M6]|uniref:peptidoglycan-binding domain-containing protein n=1 Tax=Pseudogemmobacter sp. W21_MBD1_M6 TaxID=3240271 RepID=UPI003F97A9E1